MTSFKVIRARAEKRKGGPKALEKLLLDAATKAKEIANGGDAYPVGAREMASRLAADLPTKAETIKSIVHRVG